MPELRSISYISKHTMDISLPALQEQIRNILVKAKNNNTKLNITGALLYSGGYFCQVIEGPKSNIDTLLEKILADSRHKDIIILSNEAISKRMFPDWYMAFAGIEEKMRFDIQGIKACKDEMNLKSRGQNLMNVLEQLIVNKEVLMGSKKIITDLIK